MIYQGTAIQVKKSSTGIAHLVFDLPGSAVNVFNRLMLQELQQAIVAVAGSDARGLVCAG